jgi:hypothetical protein
MPTLEQIFKKTIFEGYEYILNQRLTEAAARFVMVGRQEYGSQKDFLMAYMPQMGDILKEKYVFFVTIFEERVGKLNEEINVSKYIKSALEVRSEDEQIDLLAKITK